MGLATRRRTRAVLALLAVAALASAVDGVHLWRQHRWNLAIAADPPVAAGGTAPPSCNSHSPTQTRPAAPLKTP